MRRILIALTILLAGCAPATPSANSVETAIAETLAAQPTLSPLPTITRTATATTAPTETSTPTATDTPAPQPIVLSDSDMEAALLQISDLYPGFTFNADDSGPMTAEYMLSLRGQLYVDALTFDGEIKGYNQIFNRSDLVRGAFLRNWIVEFPGHEEARALIEDYEALSDATISLRPMSFTQYADQSIAFSGKRVLDNGDEYDAVELLIRYHNLISGVTMTARPGLLDLAEFEEYADIAADRLIQQANQSQSGATPGTEEAAATDRPVTRTPRPAFTPTEVVTDAPTATASPTRQTSTATSAATSTSAPTAASTFTSAPPTKTPTTVPTSVPPTAAPTATENPYEGCPARTCGSFGSCGAVHAYLTACPQYWGNLDNDGDGIPCEALCG